MPSLKDYSQRKKGMEHRISQQKISYNCFIVGTMNSVI